MLWGLCWTLIEGIESKVNNVKVVLLAGGLGTRMREETEYKPKPMVSVGGRPIIWHIMNLPIIDNTTV
mgnify:CR=1 FL=1